MFFAFAYSLAGGMLGVLATGRVEQIAQRFLRLVALLAFAIVALIFAWMWRYADDPLPAGASAGHIAGACAGVLSIVLVLLAPFAHRWHETYRVLCGLAGAGGITAGVLCALSLIGTNVPSVAGRALLAVSQTAGAFVLGSITVAWLLGHAYLTATRMTIAPLRHFSRMLSLAVIVRWALLLVSLILAFIAWPSDDARFIDALANAWLIVLLRVGLGLVAVGVFTYMVSDCVRLRATQSATGILYFGSLFAYAGELAGQHLIVEIGWPL